MKKLLLISALSLASSLSFANEIAPVMDKQTCEKPVYPKAALINEEAGAVALSVLVAPDGNVVDSKLKNPVALKHWTKQRSKFFLLQI
jgi:protein TonB